MKGFMQNFDIDLVYLWVDGNDVEWLNKKHTFLGKGTNLNTESLSNARNANNDELKFSLRSVEQHAPWLRTIIIVTDGQTPGWLDVLHPKIRIVDIREILPPEALPCYNSVIIEHFLYKIPNLAEHFLYANDDMFFNANLAPTFFFNKNGLPIVRLQRAFLGKWINQFKRTFNIHTNIYRKTIHIAATLIEKKFGKYFSGTPHHNIDSYLKSECKKVVEEDFKDVILPTITHHVRHETDIQRAIFVYYLLAKKKGVLKYVGRSESSRIRVRRSGFLEFLEKYNPKLFCLNDSHHATDEDRRRIAPFLTKVFPMKSQFEKI